MDPLITTSVISHQHAITAASDFPMLAVVIGAAWVIVTGFLAVIVMMCKFIISNLKARCKECSARIGGDIEELKTSCKDCRHGIWDYIDEHVWGAIESCCPRMTPSAIEKLKSILSGKKDQAFTQEQSQIGET